MKRGISLVLFIVGLWVNVSAQGVIPELKVMNVTPEGVRISGKVIKQYDTFTEPADIRWLKENASMRVKALNNIPLEKGDIWYKGVTKKTSAKYKSTEADKTRWWLKYNTTIGKGSILFTDKFYMYEDELVIQLPEVLTDGQGYKFVSLSNGKSFYCDYDDEKPLIYITRKMLDLIGFDGKSIRLKVLYINNYNQPKEITDSMIIINE